MKRLLKKLKNVFILTGRQRKLILLVFWLSIYRNILLLWGSKKGFSEHICENDKVNIPLTLEKIAIAKDIAMAIQFVNKFVPWKNVCRHQSWQAAILLLKYKIPFDFYVGINKTKNIKEGHSWIKVGDNFVCGKCNINDYIIILSK